MTIGWIALGLVGWLLGLGFVFILMRIAGDEDRAALHLEQRLSLPWIVTITQFQYGERVKRPARVYSDGRATETRRAA